MISFSELFSFLSDSTRLRCLVLLRSEGELCVCEISDTLGIIQPKVSRHLSLLRQSQLVLAERRGQWVFYQLNDAVEPQILALLIDTLDTLKSQEPFISDKKKLEAFRQSCSC